jgi:hypothetical protein
MPEEIIGMREMLAIFEVTDSLGIDRESISVPLEKEDPGSISLLDNGEIEIVVPISIPIESWVSHLLHEMGEMGFTSENNTH